MMDVGKKLNMEVATVGQLFNAAEKELIIA